MLSVLCEGWFSWVLMVMQIGVRRWASCRPFIGSRCVWIETGAARSVIRILSLRIWALSTGGICGTCSSRISTSEVGVGRVRGKRKTRAMIWASGPIVFSLLPRRDWRWAALLLTILLLRVSKETPCLRCSGLIGVCLPPSGTWPWEVCKSVGATPGCVASSRGPGPSRGIGCTPWRRCKIRCRSIRIATLSRSRRPGGGCRGRWARQVCSTSIRIIFCLDSRVTEDLMSGGDGLKLGIAFLLLARVAVRVPLES